MPAPLVAAATYFGLPRLLGGLADTAYQSRMENLTQRGVDPASDTLLNFLSLVPRRSGLEETIDTLNTLDLFRSPQNFPESEPFTEQPFGAVVTRELPYDQGTVFNTPMEDFLKYGGRDEDSGLSIEDLMRQDFESNQSYGQTNQPSEATEAPNILQGGGFAGGGLADILRMMYAKRQR